jgi:hypothetical protein
LYFILPPERMVGTLPAARQMVCLSLRIGRSWL